MEGTNSVIHETEVIKQLQWILKTALKSPWFDALIIRKSAVNIEKRSGFLDLILNWIIPGLVPSFLKRQTLF